MYGLDPANFSRTDQVNHEGSDRMLSTTTDSASCQMLDELKK